MLACVDLIIPSIFVDVDCTLILDQAHFFPGNLLELNYAVDPWVQVLNPVSNFVEIEFVIFVKYGINTLI